VRRLVLASSGAIYGDQAIQPLREDLIPIPLSPYAVSKLAAEQYVGLIGRLAGLETVCLRIFNAYGPGQQLPVTHPPVIPHFLRQALGQGSLVVHGTGAQTRDFVYVDDVVDALVAAATAPDVDQRVINIGSGTETSVNDLVRQIEAITGQEAHMLRVNEQGSGVSRMCADLTLARDLLDWTPKVFLEEGLRRTLAEDKRFAERAANGQ
jgi:UDP-glucose 4-epimerase